MIIVAYDFTSNKTRKKFSDFLEQHGKRIQYSVFELKNSKRILNLVKAEIENRFKKYFKSTDSIYLFEVCERCEKSICRYGNAVYDEQEVVYFDE